MHKQDNIIQQKIGELKEIPGELSFDAAQLWQKMEPQLQPKLKNKKAFLFGVAAFFLTAILITVIVINSGKQKDMVVQPPTQSKEPIAKLTKPVEVNSSASTISEKKTVVSKSVKGKDLSSNTDDYMGDTPVTPPLAISTIAETSITPQPTNSLTVNNVSISNTSSNKKPKLKVIHLNDLYTQNPEEIAKAEIKKQQTEEIKTETEPVINTIPKSFWKSKAPQKIAISLNDNN